MARGLDSDRRADVRALAHPALRVRDHSAAPVEGCRARSERHVFVTARLLGHDLQPHGDPSVDLRPIHFRDGRGDDQRLVQPGGHPRRSGDGTVVRAAWAALAGRSVVGQCCHRCGRSLPGAVGPAGCRTTDAARPRCGRSRSRPGPWLAHSSCTRCWDPGARVDCRRSPSVYGPRSDPPRPSTWPSGRFTLAG